MARNANIVFIHAESMDGRKMGSMGHPALRNATPHLDRLAEQGTLFTNAYMTSPVCNPSRASMWSGKYPHYYSCWNNHEGLRHGVPTFQDTFAGAGYRFSAIGPLDYVYGKHSIRDRVGSWTRAARILRPIVRTPMPRVVQNGTINEHDWQWTYRAIDELQKATSEDRPFMLYLTTGLVHPPYTSERRHLSLIDEEAIDLPPLLGPMTGSEHPAVAYTRITKNSAHPFSESMIREIRHSYFAMIAALDEMVGRVLQAIDDLGLGDSTYVIFSSDHGDMAGEQNQVLKRTFYEPSAHVPLIIRGPDVHRGATVDSPVSLVDLYPTFLDMAGIRYADCAGNPGYPDKLNGESLVPQLIGGSARQRDWAFAEYHGDRSSTGTFMLRRGPWKLIKHCGFDPELFNLETDPWERANLAKERADVVDEMERILKGNFACAVIDARAKQYDRENFMQWRSAQLTAGTYEQIMAHVYSGFDSPSIEEIAPWSHADEEKIEAWLRAG